MLSPPVLGKAHPDLVQDSLTSIRSLPHQQEPALAHVIGIDVRELGEKILSYQPCTLSHLPVAVDVPESVEIPDGKACHPVSLSSPRGDDLIPCLSPAKSIEQTGRKIRKPLRVQVLEKNHRIRKHAEHVHDKDEREK